MVLEFLKAQSPAKLLFLLVDIGITVSFGAGECCLMTTIPKNPAPNQPRQGLSVSTSKYVLTVDQTKHDISKQSTWTYII